MAFDVSKYVGIRYREKGRDAKGTDCYGLARLVYAQERDIWLPSFAGEYAGLKDAIIPVLLMRESRKWQRTDTPEMLDLILIHINGVPRHVGIYLYPGIMLHQLRGCDSCIEPYTTPLWEKRIDGIWRYNPDHRP